MRSGRSSVASVVKAFVHLGGVEDLFALPTTAREIMHVGISVYAEGMNRETGTAPIIRYDIQKLN